MTRPNPLQWVRYTFGGRLPERYRQWVLHDTTDRGWLWRFTLRVFVEALPWLVLGFVLLTVFTPLPVGFTLAAITIALATSLFFTLTSADELTEARLVKHGFRPGTGKALRKEKHVSRF